MPEPHSHHFCPELFKCGKDQKIRSRCGQNVGNGLSQLQSEDSEEPRKDKHQRDETETASERCDNGRLNAEAHGLGEHVGAVKDGKGRKRYGHHAKNSRTDCDYLRIVLPEDSDDGTGSGKGNGRQDHENKEGDFQEVTERFENPLFLPGTEVLTADRLESLTDTDHHAAYKTDVAVHNGKCRNAGVPEGSRCVIENDIGKAHHALPC